MSAGQVKVLRLNDFLEDPKYGINNAQFMEASSDISDRCGRVHTIYGRVHPRCGRVHTSDKVKKKHSLHANIERFGPWQRAHTASPSSRMIYRRILPVPKPQTSLPVVPPTATPVTRATGSRNAYW